MRKHVLIMTILLSLCLGTAYADDSFFTDDFSFDDESGSAAAPAVQINGELRSTMRAYLGEDARDALFDLDAEEDELESSAVLDMKLLYEGADFNVSSDIEIADDGSISVNEAYGQYFADTFDIETGYMKVVWGKADEYHVVDVLNSLDYSEFLKTDYLSMLNPEMMLKVNVPVGMGGLLEIAYVPTLTPATFSVGDRWEMKETKTELPAALMSLSTAYSIANPSFIGATVDTDTFDYGQGALHYTSTVEGLDYGFTYYAGYNKMPTITFAVDAAAGEVSYLFSYDPVHIFGAEAAYALGGYNLKAEAAYQMSYDFAGDDAEVSNHELKWIAGFDKDTPIGNVNIQETGVWILNSDEITAADYQYAADGTYTENLLIAALSQSIMNDKMDLSIAGFYHIEDNDFGIYPSVEYAPVDSLAFEAAGHIFAGDEDTLFGQFSDNSNLELTATLSF